MASSSLETVRAAIKLLLLAVYLGIAMIWILLPTDTYRKKWLPQLRLKYGDTTYFGRQGPNLLIHTFPVLFIAVLGCVYVHLGKKLNNYKALQSNRKKNRLGIWKRPLLVKGPLGIVSAIELAFFTMFIALLIWSLAIYLSNGFAKITPESAAEDGLKVWQDKLKDTGLRLGLVGNICLTLLFFPVARGSSVLPLFGLTSEASIKYHIWLGHIVMTLFTAHGVCYIILWIVKNNLSKVLQWSTTGVSIVAGEVALLSGLVMWATTYRRIRQKCFELFFYTHYLYIVFVVFFFFHISISYSMIMLPGFYLFVVDRYLRFLQSRNSVRLVSARLLPCETVELSFSKAPSLSYSPTSIMFVNVPSISKLQWHPFSITSSSNLEPESLSVMIKGEGSWSKKLYYVLSSPTSVDHLEISVEGPYGPISTDFLRHEALVMVCGGSGITPFISIIRELIYASTVTNCRTPQVLLICSFKSSSDLTTLDLLLPVSGTPIELSNLKLQIEAYVTREKRPTIADSSNLLRAIWFKPRESDAPISSILGPNSWLWLGAILSSSFIIFLILMGIIGKYYIYPIDENTYKKFNSSWRAFLNVLVISVSVAASATAAVLWNKGHNAKEARKIKHMEGSTPAGSPNSDRELESVPRQSLIQATNVTYGERPDFKRLLFGRKESSVGVLVCGPKLMRHEVATICSSGLADNLHFESISFSW